MTTTSTIFQAPDYNMKVGNAVPSDVKLSLLHTSGGLGFDQTHSQDSNYVAEDTIVLEKKIHVHNID